MGKRNTKRALRRAKPGRGRLTATSGSAPLEARPTSTISISPALAEPGPISVTYGFVRSRQLEGTFPGAPETGVWPITSNRIAYGWGLVNLKDWPDTPNDKQWPPIEPEGLDRLARRMRVGHYQRARSLKDCKYALAAGHIPRTSFRISKQWFHAEKGVIPDPLPDDEIIGSHAVTFLGYDDHTRKIKFVNSWGQGWGDEGFGTLSYAHFEERSVESWIQSFGSPTWWLVENAARFLDRHVSQALDIRDRVWGVRDILRGEVIHVSELYDLANDERIGWAFAVPRDGFLDVEELFVRPQYRRRGYATRLAKLLRKTSDSLNVPLRLWVSYADCGEENRAALEGVLRKLDLSLRNSSCRWAAYVALGGSPSEQPLNPIIIPDRPAMIRGAWKAAILASSLAVGSAVQDVAHDDRKQLSLDDPTSSHLVNSSTHPDDKVEQDGDELLPGVEYDIVLTAPPRESVSCTGIIVSISKGRTDSPLSDSDWAGMMIDEDED
jgi:GNAT superfamily N-acetyltransferase